MAMAILQLLVHLQLIAAVGSFALLKQNAAMPSRTQLCAMRSDRKHGGHSSKHHHAAPNRVPLNKRTAIRWVVQGVERCLAEEEPGKGREGKSYARRMDASLVDALFLMVNANNQKDVLDAEKRIRVLMKNPGEFPREVNERVIKACAMAGLAPLSRSLLEALLEDGEDLPSPMAYTAVLNVLRRNGRMERLEETLADLASACRKIKQTTGKDVGVDIVAFNTYLASICDAAVNELPFSSFETDIDGLKEEFNYTSLTNISTASPSEQHLYKALNLLKGAVARKKFSLESDPDRYSYNSVLIAAAKCSKNDFGESFHVTKSIMLACLRGMKERGIRPDIVTYNARIQAALVLDGDEDAIRQIDHVLSDHNVEPDRYTIDLMLKPFINAGRVDELWSILKKFFEQNVGSNGKRVSSAFEAFLDTLVQSGHVEFAHEVFRAFFLPAPKERKHMQLTQMIHVLSEEEQQQSLQPSGVTRGTTGVTTHLLPGRRHFNILIGGYGKAYQSALSKMGKARLQAAKRNETIDEGENATATFIPDVSEAYALFDTMLDMGVRLDQFTLTSLMALPSTSENVTSLLDRVESALVGDFNPAAYRSIISAYGKAGDPSSACWMFEEMAGVGRNLQKRENWNVLLGALAKCCSEEACHIQLDVLNSVAARARRDTDISANDGGLVTSIVDCQTCLDAATLILDTMRNRTVIGECTAPPPNSQTYCLVASALSESGTSEPKPTRALKLFRVAMEEGVSADGRFLNAVLRCFGDDIEGALAAWKSDIGPAAAAYEQRSNKQGTNLIAAYNGLMHVCGRAIRPDIATRIAYAMKKSNVEPSEVTLNSYLAGKRVAIDKFGEGKNLRLQNQYESLLSVECLKYNEKDKRRANDRKIRIIF